MRVFIYCRPAVTEGDRGYRVIPGQGLSEQDAKQLRDLFSDRDPAAARLQQDHDAPFYAYFPWRDDDWVFGKGRIERQQTQAGIYTSYLFHGCVLSAEDRQRLHFNPFVLSDFFTLDQEHRLNMPKLPASLPSKALYLNVIHKAKRTIHHEQGAAVPQVASMAATLSRLDPAENLTFDHRARWDGDFWSLVFFLLPKPLRARFSIVTFAPFLEQRPRLRGLVWEQPSSTTPNGAAPNGPPTRHFEETALAKSVAADFLNQLTRAEDELLLLPRMRAFEMAMTDWLHGLNHGETLDENAYIAALFRAMERPSARSVREWPRSGFALLPHKMEHFHRVWRRYQWEQGRYTTLADQIWQSLVADIAVLAQADDARIKTVHQSTLALFDDLAASLSPSALIASLRVQPLADWLNPRIEANTWLTAVCAVSLEEWNATVFSSRSTADPDHWPNTLVQLVQTYWGRALHEVRAGNPHACLRALRLCLDLDPKTFAVATAPILIARHMTGLLPFLAAEANLANACFDIWEQTFQTYQQKQSSRSATAALRLRILDRCLGWQRAPSFPQLENNRLLLWCLDQISGAIMGQEA